MPLQLSLAGSQIVGGPAAAQGFPSAALDLTFQLNPDPKQYSTTTGAGTFTLNSPSSFQAMGGLGAGEQVTLAHTVYIRSGAVPMKVRLTFVDTTTATIPFNGLLVFEAAAGNECTQVAVEGSGTLEFAAWGNS